MDDSCTTLRVEGIKRGHTEITVYYEQQNVKLSTSVTVAAFLPLEVSIRWGGGGVLKYFFSIDH